MRIVHVGTRLPEATTPGGGGNYPYDLAKAESELGEDVEIWGCGAGSKWLKHRVDGALQVYYERPITIRPFHQSDPLFVRFFLRLAFGQKPDVVHFYQYKIIQYRWLIPLARRRGCAICLTDLGGGGWRNLPARIGAMVDRFLLLSQYNARFFLRGYETEFKTDHGLWATDHNYSGSPDRIVVIGGGVNEKFFMPREGPPDLPPYLLYVGRAMPHKGLEVIIRALGRLSERFPSLQLRIAGPQKVTEYLQFLRAESERLGVADRVIFLGYCTPDTLLQTYQGATALVMASTYRPIDGRRLAKPELLGLVLLEAMACRVPVICSRVAGLLETVHEGETGLTFEDRDEAGLAGCIERLLTDAELRNKLIENAYRMVQEKYTWTRVAQKCLETYKELLRQPT
ncbi:MAG: glycosyltransferase family 4 protein [Candidatus Sumerlaeia bacterium]|nr:glycosyltransferase family 4 protein [Candidatus Sumerlaeia bacterium]